MRRGFTLIETVIASGLLLLLLGAILGTTMLSTNLSAKLSRSVVTAQRGRLSLERIGMDIQAADRVLTRYPTAGAALFTADRTSTLILRMPRPSAPGDYDVAIYRTRDDATDGPKVLEAYSAEIVGGQQRPAQLEGVVAREVTAFRISLSAHETFLGNGNHNRFVLRSRATGHDALSRQNVLLLGQDRIALTESGNAGDQAIDLDDTQLVFQKAPPNGALIDAFYNVNPAEAALADGGTNASIVTYGLVLSPRSRDGGHRRTQRESNISTRLSLRNR